MPVTADTELLKARLERVEGELAFFMELGRKLTATLDDQKVLEIIAEGTHAYLSPSHTTLYVVGGDRRTYGLAMAKGYKPDNPDAEVSILEGCSGQVLRTGSQLRLGDKELRQYPNLPADLCMPGPLADVLCIPIMHRKRALAALVITQTRDAGRLSDVHLERLKRLMEQTRMAVDRALLYKKTAHLAITDDLTGLFNHRYIHQSLEAKIKEYKQTDGNLGLIFMDLDNFKTINDTHGHLAGSHALTEVGNILVDNLRADDIIARYGGDEFVIILPGTTLKVSQQIAKRLCRSLAAATVLPQYGGLSLAASFGVAAFPEHATTPRRLVQQADRAMYVAKREGGNRAMLATSKR